MKSLLFISAVVVSLVSSVKWSDEKIDNLEHFNSMNHKAVFDEWRQEFNRTYVSIEEEGHKFITWLDNWHKILKHNHESGASYTLRLNQFGDMTSQEFRDYVHGPKGSCLKRKPRGETPIVLNAAASYNQNKGISVAANPTTVDWRTKNVVTPVKNQGSCGSCWAFSSTGSIECRVAIATGVLNSLSEQQLVDCSGSYGNDGCSGGLMDDAFKYVEASGGLCTEAEYPYKGVDGICTSSTCGTKYDPISSYSDVKSDNEADLETAVSQGCVSVAIEADQLAFQYYSGGILDTTCGTELDHGVLLVGYNNEETDSEYWILKNSWGTSWGIQGYAYLCKDCNKNGNEGECGVNREPSYPQSKNQ